MTVETTVQEAVKALALLTAVPIVLFALWVDYFGRGLDALAQQNPYYDRAAELYKIRLAGLCAIFFQLGIYIGTGSIRTEAPLLANLVFAAGILLQSSIQARLERKVRKPMPKLRPEADTQSTRSNEIRSGSGALGPQPLREPLQEMDFAFRAFLWASLGGALYLTGFALPVIVVSFCARFVHASQGVLTAVIITSAVMGMVAGVAINFALGAFYLRRMLPTRAIEAGPLRAGIESCFGRAGLRTPTLWIVETGRKREATAMMAGFPSGRGFFTPGLFLSRGLLDTLSEEELQAVVLHEVSHLKLRHLQKRLFYSAALVIGTTAAATFCVFLASVWMPQSDLRGFVSLAAAAGAFVLTFAKLGAQSRDHELEADFHSVEKLGAGAENLVSALLKLDVANGKMAAPLKAMSGHPATDLRVKALRARFPEAPSDSQDSGDWRKAA